ncbi:MAG: sensor histidine kinase [Lachnospiraceae bacterium]
MKNPFKAIKNSYIYNISLSSKLIISYWILLAIPTLVISIFLYGQIYDIIINDTLRSTQALSQQSVETVNANLSRLTNVADTLVEDQFVQKLSENSEQPSLVDFNAEDAQLFSATLQSSIDSYFITDIRLFVDERYTLPVRAEAEDTEEEDTSPYLSIYDAKGTYWYGIFHSSNVSELFCPTFYLSPYESETYGDMAYIRKITYQDDSQQTALYMAIFYDQSTLNNSLSQNMTIDDSVSYIINSRDNMVATSDASLSGTYYTSYEVLSAAEQNPNIFDVKDVLGNKVYIGKYKVSKADWYLVTVLPARPLLQKGNRLIFQFVLFYLLFLVLAFFIATRLSRSISNRISFVIDKMSSVRFGALSPIQQKIVPKDEIGSLILSYNYMVHRIEALRIEQSHAADNLRNAEIQALQAQINPHFLYNTLDMINWLAQSGQSGEVTHAIQSLSKFYKLTLSKKGTYNTIEMELQHVTLYVGLQNMRYKNQIKFLIDVPEDVYDCEIPKLTFQPIIENAIQHGLLARDEKEGSIVLTAWIEDSDIVFLISDDGVGMDAETLENILSGTAHSKTGSSIGVFNTHKRLSLLYGAQYGLTYQSRLGEGTDVYIHIPFIDHM